MTVSVRECYDKLGGDYDDVYSRLLTEDRIIKFILRFLDDDSYKKICESLNTGDHDTAFRAAHTLKGIAQNFSFTRLYESTSLLTDALRPGKEPTPQHEIEALTKKVGTDYGKVVDAITLFKESI